MARGRLLVELGTDLWIMSDRIEAVKVACPDDFGLPQEHVTLIFLIGTQGSYMSDWPVQKVLAALGERQEEEE